MLRALARRPLLAAASFAAGASFFVASAHAASVPTTGAAVFSSHPVEWRIPIGCDFSGFFVEAPV